MPQTIPLRVFVKTLLEEPLETAMGEDKAAKGSGP
jgi:hypothetical protein